MGRVSVRGLKRGVGLCGGFARCGRGQLDVQ